MPMTPMELTGALNDLQQRMAALEAFVGVERGQAPPAAGCFDVQPEGVAVANGDPPQPPEAGQSAENLMPPPPPDPLRTGDGRATAGWSEGSIDAKA